jgi:uroporphyrinogen-III synthase
MAADLAGLRVVVTRARHQAGGLVAGLRAAGARVEELPLLAVVPPADLRPLERAASELPLFDWLVFSSANAVEALLSLAGGALPARLSVAVVGAATAAAVRGFAVEPRLEAPRADAESLAGELAPLVARRRRVLLPQAADARPVIAELLAAAGAEVVPIVAYDKRLPDDAAARARELFAGEPIGWVTFTSPRIVRHFVQVIGEEWPARRGELLAAAIGSVTASELSRHGVEPAAEALEASDEGLVAAVAAAARRGGL